RAASLGDAEKALDRCRHAYEDVDRPSRPPTREDLPVPDLQDEVEQLGQSFTPARALATDLVGNGHAEGLAWSPLRWAVVDCGDAPHEDADEGRNSEDLGVAGGNGKQTRRGQQRSEERRVGKAWR